VERDQLTPAQRRLLEELLQIDAPRPQPEPGLSEHLRGLVERAVAPAAEVIPPGETLRLHKAALSALSCDGRYLDLVDQPFAFRAA
jgi:hypothetical protein